MICAGCCFNQLQTVDCLCVKCNLCKDGCCECPKRPKRTKEFEDFIQSVKKTKKVLVDECERCETMFVLEDLEKQYIQCEACCRIIACDNVECDRKCIFEQDDTDMCRECYFKKE